MKRPALGTLTALCGALTLAASPGSGASRPGPARGAAVTVCAVGDILLARGVARSAARSGPRYPFARVRSLLATGDIAIGNLECAISTRPPVLRKRFNFAAPPGSARVLRLGGIRIVNLANNHSMDCGRRGLLDTMRALRSAQIRWCGAGTSMEEAERPTIVRVRGVRVGFLGFSRFLPEGSFLTEGRPTFAFLARQRVRRAVTCARARCDVLIVSAHWGTEYDPRPSDEQNSLARVMVNAGADLVIGSHPHVLQPLRASRQAARRALVAYSLGNFVFDGRGPIAARTGVLRVTLTRGGGVTGARFIPCTIDGRRPRPATKAESRRTLDRLRTLSAEVGTRIDRSGALR